MPSTLTSPFNGLRQRKHLNPLIRTMFLPPVPMRLTAAFSRFCIDKYGTSNIQCVLAGPPGTGKSELLKNLSRHLNVGGNVLIDGFACSTALDQYWESGVVSQEHVQRLTQMRNDGEILPDVDVRAALDYMFSLLKSKPKILTLDGAIRTPDQILMAYLYAFLYMSNFGVIELFAEPDECKRRIGIRPGAESRPDTAKAAQRIERFGRITRPALGLVRTDIGPNHLFVNTQVLNPMQTCRRVMRHLCHLATQEFDLGVLQVLIDRCRANRAPVF